MRLETTTTGAAVRRPLLRPCVLEDTFKGQNEQQDEERTARSLIERDRLPAAARARPPKISAARKAVRAARRPAAPHLTTAAPGRSARRAATSFPAGGRSGGFAKDGGRRSKRRGQVAVPREALLKTTRVHSPECWGTRGVQPGLAVSAVLDCCAFCFAAARWRSL